MLQFIKHPSNILTISGIKNEALGTAISILLLFSLLVLLVLGQKLPSMIEPKLEVREINIAVPPPPPPPPPQVTQPQVDTPIDLAIAGTGAALPKVDIPPEVTISQPDTPDFKMDQVEFSDFAPELDIFSLNELDALPTLLTSARVMLPNNLKKQGIKKVKVRLDVTIDQDGKVKLNRVAENPHPELNKEIERLVRRSKFTVPKKNGAAVSARFIWPIDISS